MQLSSCTYSVQSAPKDRSSKLFRNIGNTSYSSLLHFVGWAERSESQGWVWGPKMLNGSIALAEITKLKVTFWHVLAQENCWLQHIKSCPQ